MRPLITVLAVLAVACGGTARTTTTTVSTSTTTTEAPAGPPTGPASVVFSDQESDGTTVLVSEVELPAAGFVVIHADADGAPGPVIGHSDLLPAGASRDVEVTLDRPLSDTAVVWPMAHIDTNQNGVYEFDPPTVAVDGPATTADGQVAVVSGTVTVVTSAGPALTVADSPLGRILVDDQGFTVYLFLPDSQGEPTCYDACAAIWPAVPAGLGAGEGVDPALIGRASRTDGPAQLTYNGWPLYYFANDSEPGDTNGQGVNDVWFVVSPEGEPVMGG
jgi:predicted lipoprotein with Yx(FWY)xxD motif